MSHPMFDRIDRRMKILQRQIDEKKGGGDAPATAPAAKPPTPAGILTQNNGKPKPMPSPATVLTDADVIAATLPAKALLAEARREKRASAWREMRRRIQDGCIRFPAPPQSAPPGQEFNDVTDAISYSFTALKKRQEDPRCLGIHLAMVESLVTGIGFVDHMGRFVPTAELCCDDPPTSPGASHAEEA